jgi:hypothetical protein
MTQHDTSPTEATRDRKPSMGVGRRRRWLAISAWITAVSAWAGALGLASGGIKLEAGMNQRLPFDSPLFAGVALAAIVGLPFTAAAVLAWPDRPGAGVVATGAGVLLMGWIVVELAFIRSLSFFHPLYFLVGLAFLLAGWRDAALVIRAGRWSHPGRKSPRHR